MKLQLKRSNVIELGAAKEPTPEQMEYGELAVNYNGEDPAVFIKDSNDQIIRIAGSGNIGSGDTPSGPDLPSTGNDVGDLFFDTINNTLFYWNGSEWVPIEANKSENIFVGTETEVDFYLSPASRPEGFLWWNVEDETLYVWYDNSGSPEWRPATPVSSEGGASVTISDTPPATGDTEIGDLWWDSRDGRLYIYYEDTSSAQWVDASPKGDSIEDAPADGNQYARKDNNWTVVESTGGGGGGDGGGGGGDTIISYSGAAAWANVAPDGTIEGGLNVASVVKTGASTTAFYALTFQTPMPDANYSVTGSCFTDGVQAGVWIVVTEQSATGFTYFQTNYTGIVDTHNAMLQVAATNALPPKGGTGTDAWATVDKTTVNGPCNVPASFNVASVTRAAAGLYDVVFTTPMPTANYSAVATADWDGSGNFPGCSIQNPTTTGFRVIVLDTGYVDSGFGFQVNATNATLPLTVTQEQIEAAIYNPGASAWGDVAADGTLLGGLNVSMSGNYPHVVTFHTPMPDANYSVTFGGYATPAIYGEKTATGFEYYVYNADGTGTTAYASSFAVFATNALPPKGGTGTDSWATCQADGTIDASFNVASVTRAAQGTYDVVFTTPMPTANYAVTGSCEDSSSINMSFVVKAKLTSGFTYATIRDNQAEVDVPSSFTVNCTNATLPQTVTEEMINAAIYNPGASAWGNVAADGTLISGLNISSVTWNGGNLYDVVFLTPMPDANYSFVGSGDTSFGYIQTGTKTANGFTYGTCDGNGNIAYGCSFAIFATNALLPKGGTGTDSWATVDKTTVNGPCNVPASFNVASVTRTAKGKYDVLFTTPMPTANYAVNATVTADTTIDAPCVSAYNITSTGFSIYTTNTVNAIERSFASPSTPPTQRCLLHLLKKKFKQLLT